MGGVGSHAIFQQRWEDKFPAGGRQGELGQGGEEGGRARLGKCDHTGALVCGLVAEPWR